MWHKLTPLFCRTIFDRIVLVNNHWDHYPLIQRIESGAFKPPITKNVPPIENYYYNFPAPATNKIVKILEYNGPTNFYPLSKQGVDVHAYTKGEFLHTYSQTSPDVTLDFRESSFQDKRAHGNDFKAYENPREFECRTFSNISEEKFLNGLTGFEALINSNLPELTIDQLNNISKAIKQLKNTCNNIAEHQIAWAQTLHYFPDKYIPPMRVPQNFCIQDLKPEALSAFTKSHIRMNKISDLLKKCNVPKNDYKKALDIFQDSNIQAILTKIFNHKSLLPIFLKRK